MSWVKVYRQQQCKAKQLKFLSPQIITGRRALAIQEKSTIIYDSRHPTSFFPKSKYGNFIIVVFMTEKLCPLYSNFHFTQSKGNRCEIAEA